MKIGWDCCPLGFSDGFLIPKYSSRHGTPFIHFSESFSSTNYLRLPFTRLHMKDVWETASWAVELVTLEQIRRSIWRSTFFFSDHFPWGTRWGFPRMEYPQNWWFTMGKAYCNGWFRGTLWLRKAVSMFLHLSYWRVFHSVYFCLADQQVDI